MPHNLKEYARKRHFDKTAEPRGDVRPKDSPQLRFVVQHHIASRDHYDFRLEWDGVLKSWAVPKGPSYDNHDKRLAIQVEDHPLEYRAFEGTIPKGQYGGGVVMIWDEGNWYPEGDAGEGLADGSLKFTLEGSRLKGRWALVRMKPKSGEKNTNWLLIKETDDYLNAYDIREFTTSVATGRTLTEIEQGKTGTDPKEQGADKREAKQAQVPPHDGIPPSRPARPVADVTLTHPEKVLYEESGITKGDIARYYLAVAERMMPYLANRVFSAVRCPDGIDESCFYKKHPANDKYGVVPVTVPVNDGKTEEYYIIPDSYALLSEVQMNTLEFHIWGSRIETLEQPDMMVFDLDPDEGMDLERIRQGVKDLKSLLDQLDLVSYLKTSGGKGYHVVVPFRAAAGWDAFREFARNTAKTMEAMWPDRYTSNVRKDRRKNRIFIDWIRNGRGATSIAPYSVRARNGGPVSMPISWPELDKITPQGISMAEAIKRLRRKDPWADFADTDQQLK